MKVLTTISNIQAEHIRWIFPANNSFPFLDKLHFKMTVLKGMKISERHNRNISWNVVSLLFTDRLPYMPITYVLLKKLIRKCENYVANTTVALPGSILELFPAAWEPFYFAVPSVFVKGNVGAHWDQNWHSSCLKQTITNFSVRLPERNSMQWLGEQA